MSRARRKPPRTVAHYGAPVAFLAAVTIAVLLVHSALGHKSNGTTVTTATGQTTATSVSTSTRKANGKKAFYVVQTGDTFGSIAGKEGISLEELQALNPGVSSNTLQVGQKLRVK